MELGFTGKVVGITGAGSKEGIGYAIARGFLEEGAKVFLCDLNEEKVREVEEDLKQFGDVKAYVVNVADEDQVAELFRKALEDFGKIDVFVNNAGIYPQSALQDMSVSLWDRVISVNLRSVFLCGSKAREVMAGSGGVIINACSYAALIGSAGSGAYAASKSAVYSLTKTMAAEYAPFGIRVNGFIPGVIETGMTREVVEARGDALVSQIALHRLGKPSDVAKAVLFLASDQASYLTGTFIEVSGGKFCVQNPDYGYQKWGDQR